MSKIKLTILGTTAGVPTKNRAHSAFHLVYDDGVEYDMLFDCGEGTQRQFLIAGINPMRIDRIFITHWHGDHCLGLPGLLDTMGFDGRTKPVTVFAPEAKRVRDIFRFSYAMGRFRIQAAKVPTRVREERTVLEEERFRITSVPVVHSIPCVAYAFIEKDKKVIDANKALAAGLPEEGRIYAELKEKGAVKLDAGRVTIDEVSHTVKGRKIVLSGDTEICGNLERIAQGADLLLQDCTYFDDINKKEKPHKHASLNEVLDMVGRLDIKRTVLTHIGRRHKDIEELRAMVSGRSDIVIAEDFMKIEM